MIPQIQPVFAQHAGNVSMGVTGNSDFRVTRTEPALAYKTFPLAPRLEADAELLRVFGERTGPNRDVKVRYEGAVAVTVEDGRWARDTLDQVGAMIAQLFTEIEPTLWPFPLLFVTRHHLPPAPALCTAVEEISSLSW